MTTMPKTLRAILAVAFAVSVWLLPHAATPIRVLLLDGANNHDWKSTTPVIKKVLEEPGLFATTVTTVDNADLNAFRPDWSRYDVVVLNYNTGIAGDAPEWLP